MNITTFCGVLALRGNAPAYVSVRKSKHIKDEAENFGGKLDFVWRATFIISCRGMPYGRPALLACCYRGQAHLDVLLSSQPQLALVGRP